MAGYKLPKLPNHEAARQGSKHNPTSRTNMKSVLIALAAAPAAGLMVELAVDLNSPDMEASVRARRLATPRPPRGSP